MGKKKKKKKEEIQITAEPKTGLPEEFELRFEKHHDELRWLYMELYDNGSMFAELCERLKQFYMERKEALKELDRRREADPAWYRQNDMLGMMFYIDNFAKTINGVEEKLSYIEKCRANYIHLMPFLETPKGRSDGGYAVSDFQQVQKDLGTMEDLESLTEACHKRGIHVCMDFVMNHTSEDHAWAVKAREGDGEYMSRYFFFENSYIPSLYEKTAGISDYGSRQFYLAAGSEAFCYDVVLPVPVGFKL